MLLNSPIKMEWFYEIYDYKTKLNQFLYEFALEYYDHIKDNEKLAVYRKQYSSQDIAVYCTYYARRLKESALKAVKGQRKTLIFYYEYAVDYYPHFGE